MGWNDHRGSFCPGMERLQGSPSVLVWNDSRGVLLTRNGTTKGESFCPGMERLQGSHSIKGWNDSRGVILSWDRRIPEESFCNGIERLHGSPTVLERTSSS